MRVRFARASALALLALIALAWSPLHADAQVRRCVGIDGTQVFTDQQCQDIGAVERPIDAIRESGAIGSGGGYARGCSRNLRDLITEVTSAIDSRDVNRLAGVYNWAGMSSANGYALLGRLDAIVQRPLVDIRAIVPEPPANDYASAIVYDGTPSTPGAATTSPDVGADVALEAPRPAPRRTPTGLRLEQTLANGSTPSRTVFGLRQYMGCWWVTL